MTMEINTKGKRFSNLPKDSRKHRSYLLKRIMPNTCDFCGIGIGKSMMFLEGRWKQFEHMHRKVHLLRHGGERYKLCGECMLDVRGADDLDNFMRARERKLALDKLDK